MAETPHGMSFTNITTAEDLARNRARFQVGVVSVTHRCPVRGSALTPCCERTPFELPVWDRLAVDDALVDCADLRT